MTELLLRNAKVNGEPRDLLIIDGVIASVRPAGGDGDGCETVDLAGAAVWPGLIDIHIHGCAGADTMDGELETMSRHLAKNGVTAWLPTAMAAPLDVLRSLTANLPAVSGAVPLGYHLEGPFLAPGKAGAMKREFLISPTGDALRGFDNLKMMTVAPELPGAKLLIAAYAAKGISISIGHTECDYDTAVKAVELGANCLTHTFNAMPPLLHREPGPIGAALVKGIYAQVICDGIHLHKAAVLALYRMFTADRMILISDSMRAAGMPDGEYDLGGQKMTVTGGVARTAEGNLAGSTASLLHCVKTAVSFGIPENDAVKMATETPAALLGVKKGKIAPGYDADLLVMNPDLTPKEVYIGGRRFLS